MNIQKVFSRMGTKGNRFPGNKNNSWYGVVSEHPSDGKFIILQKGEGIFPISVQGQSESALIRMEIMLLAAVDTRTERWNSN